MFTRIAVALVALIFVSAQDVSWRTLFDQKSLTGWKSTNFGGEGEVIVKDKLLLLERGEPMTGVTFAGKDFPKMNYEVTVEAKRVAGGDFFATTTFPVGEQFCSFVVGGWGGSVIGISSINEMDASDNETSEQFQFKNDQWYKIRIRVTPGKIACWIDDKQVVDVETADKKISTRAECDACKPFGIATWRTAAAVREIRVRNIEKSSK